MKSGACLLELHKTAHEDTQAALAISKGPAKLTSGQLTLWKGVSAATGPSLHMAWAARPPRPATSHSGRAPATNTPLWLAPRAWRGRHGGRVGGWVGGCRCRVGMAKQLTQRRTDWLADGTTKPYQDTFPSGSSSTGMSSLYLAYRASHHSPVLADRCTRCGRTG